MTRAQEPSQHWWSAAELANAGLPDLPGTKRNVTKLAQRLGWDTHPTAARRRKARGGGYEYHWSLLPMRARTALLDAASAPEAEEPIERSRDEAWTWFDTLPERTKLEARARVAALDDVKELQATGMTIVAAVDIVGARVEKSSSTIFNWLNMVAGVARADRLAYVARRNKGAQTTNRRAQIDPEFGDLIKSDYLRQAEPSLTSVYDRACRVAREEGFDIPHIQAVRRWLRRTVTKPAMVYHRKGPRALKALYPAQTRDKTAMHALEGVNGDYHRFDVMVRFPDGHIYRPQMVAWQDIYSGRILSWRLDTSANSHTVQMCFGDLIEDWGIPEHILIDNGREFATKILSGQSETRFRGKILEDDVQGLWPALGCKVHWAQPYHGQAKPIERAFRDVCDRISKHPAFEGAYTGNSPLAKPENYGSRAVEFDEFIKVVGVEIEHHNFRADRRSEVAYGRSFAEVFDESYATATIRKATEAQRRMWLMGMKGVKAKATNGEVEVLENRYWANWMHQIAGQKVIVRFDKADLWAGAHIYDLDNSYLGHAPVFVKGQFFDVEAAVHLQRAKAAWQRQEKRASAAHKKYSASEVAARYAGIEKDTPEVTKPEATVVQADFTAPKSATDRPKTAELENRLAENEATVASLAARRTAKVKSQDEESEAERFQRYLSLEARAEAGDDLAPEQRTFLELYPTTSEYRSHLRLHQRSGQRPNT